MHFGSTFKVCSVLTLSVFLTYSQLSYAMACNEFFAQPIEKNESEVQSTALSFDPSLHERVRKALLETLRKRVNGIRDNQVLNMGLQSGFITMDEARSGLQQGYATGVGELLGEAQFPDMLPTKPIIENDEMVQLRWRLTEDGHIQILSNWSLNDQLSTPESLAIQDRQDRLEQHKKVNEKLYYHGTMADKYVADYLAAQTVGDRATMKRALSDLFATRDYIELIDLGTSTGSKEILLQSAKASFLDWKKHREYIHDGTVNTHYLRHTLEALRRIDGKDREEAVALTKLIAIDTIVNHPEEYDEIFRALLDTGRIDMQFSAGELNKILLTRIEDPSIRELSIRLLEKYEHEILPNRHADNGYFFLKYAIGHIQTFEQLRREMGYLGAITFFAVGSAENLKQPDLNAENAYKMAEYVRANIRTMKKLNRNHVNRAIQESDAYMQKGSRDYNPYLAFLRLIEADEIKRELRRRRPKTNPGK